IALAVLFIYEIVITATDEVNYFWRRKWTGASVLFVLNRYTVLVYDLMSIIIFFSTESDKGLSCAALARTTRVISILQYLPWAAFSGLRTLALSQNKALATLVFLLSSAPIGVNMAEFRFDITGIEDPVFGCPSQLSNCRCFHRVTIVSRTGLITSDVLLLLITWYRFSRGMRLSKKTFGHVIFRDGTVYFVCLLAFNTIHLTLTMVSIIHPLQAHSYVTTFTEPLTAILVSRFLLNLQRANRQAVDHVSESMSQPSGGQADSLVFNRVIGSLGSTFTPGEVDDVGLGTSLISEDAASDDCRNVPAAYPDSDDTVRP
ncbi:hypothetical protein C8Q76DRAFT_620410, partial [Earliella scabrosa]